MITGSPPKFYETRDNLAGWLPPRAAPARRFEVRACGLADCPRAVPAVPRRAGSHFGRRRRAAGSAVAAACPTRPRRWPRQPRAGRSRGRRRPGAVHQRSRDRAGVVRGVYVYPGSWSRRRSDDRIGGTRGPAIVDGTHARRRSAGGQAAATRGSAPPARAAGRSRSRFVGLWRASTALRRPKRSYRSRRSGQKPLR